MSSPRLPLVAVPLAAAAVLLAGCGSTTTSAPSPSRSSVPVQPSPSDTEPTDTSPTDPLPTDTTPSAGTSAGVGTSEPVATSATPQPTTTAPSPTLTTPPTTGATPTASPNLRLRQGDEGPQVRALQERLRDLGYWLGTPDGAFGDATHHAVVALQKASGLGRDGVVGPATRRALDQGVRWAPDVRGDAMVIDLRRQLLAVVRDGRTTLVLDVSTGSGRTYTQPDGDRATATTPQGSFRVAWQVDGWRTSDLGRLYRPKYFHPRGIAVHGYPSVPPTPASHGCVRVTMAAMDMIWREGFMPVGSRVVVL
ncbi:MAG: L,D-transpeptidase family protein [Kineosporiaceae bacterium]